MGVFPPIVVLSGPHFQTRTDNATTADDLAEEVSKTYGVKCKAFKMPAGNSTLIDETVARITKDMGEIDVVIANAGICLHVDAVVRFFFSCLGCVAGRC